jgi:hypothetical protein
MTCKDKNDIIKELSGDVYYEVEVTASQRFIVKAKDCDDIQDIIYNAVEDEVQSGNLEVTSRDCWDNIEVLEEVGETEQFDLEVDEGYYND